jgi:hypothetical protein
MRLRFAADTTTPVSSTREPRATIGAPGPGAGIMMSPRMVTPAPTTKTDLDDMDRGSHGARRGRAGTSSFAAFRTSQRSIAEGLASWRTAAYGRFKFPSEFARRPRLRFPFGPELVSDFAPPITRTRLTGAADHAKAVRRQVCELRMIFGSAPDGGLSPRDLLLRLGERHERPGPANSQQ